LQNLNTTLNNISTTLGKIQTTLEGIEKRTGATPVPKPNRKNGEDEDSARKTTPQEEEVSAIVQKWRESLRKKNALKQAQVGEEDKGRAAKPPVPLVQGRSAAMQVADGGTLEPRSRKKEEDRQGQYR
jgi:hypothetical protein